MGQGAGCSDIEVVLVTGHRAAGRPYPLQPKSRRTPPGKRVTQPVLLVSLLRRTLHNLRRKPSPVQTTIDGYAMGLAERSFQIV